MKFIYIFLVITLFTFQGCTTKEASPNSNHQPNKTDPLTTAPLTTATSDEPMKDDQAEEFEEEFSEQETSTASDPLSGYNRVMTSFNDTFILYALNPVSKVYAAVIPQPLRLGLSNAVDNLRFPIRFANNLLQGKFQNSSDELERFIINSTVGLGGLIDVATDYMTTPIPAHDEDFGQTLGHYGIGSGFHVVLPFIGPSNIRDIVGLTADAYLSPIVHVNGLDHYKIPQNLNQSVGIYSVHTINKTSLHLGEYENLREDAIDLYPFFRDTYEQKRNSDITE
ncbi:VacJ family lipoprotein [Sulfurovum sp. XGS-02]|uniref:MlaA family lipoprotein n=1 Tax=Sulfurovum sp. XGS-02 TaxID=2925411 RepID=UPI002050D4C2|nr:VacJ family lipoprotein [Sulfurovum sp. XGS-02]UPT76929.1 VacJ family lipoprotein [Sulfurovum sp. XGS-02]